MVSINSQNQQSLISYMKIMKHSLEIFVHCIFGGVLMLASIPPFSYLIISKNRLTAADVTEDLENNLSASLNFLFLLSPLLLVFLEKMLFSAKKKMYYYTATQQTC